MSGDVRMKELRVWRLLLNVRMTAVGCLILETSPVVQACRRTASGIPRRWNGRGAQTGFALALHSIVIRRKTGGRCVRCPRVCTDEKLGVQPLASTPDRSAGDVECGDRQRQQCQADRDGKTIEHTYEGGVTLCCYREKFGETFGIAQSIPAKDTPNNN